MVFKFAFLSRPQSKAALYGEAPKASVSPYLRHRELGHSSHRQPTCAAAEEKMSAMLARKLPATLSEQQFVLDGYDKVFASKWVNASEVVLATKCNRLLMLNVDTGRRFELPTPPSALHALALQNNGVATTQATPPCSGIHAIAVNPSGTRLAVGTGKPLEVVIYDLPSMEPVAVCSGHTDLVFSLEFMTDDLLVTGSRDSCLGVFSLKQCNNGMGSDNVPTLSTFTGNVSVHAPLGMRREHKNKVRSLQYNADHRQIATLGADGLLKLWDANRLDVVATTELQYPTETVCLALEKSSNMYAVGSQGHISMYDPRSRRIVDSFTSMDDGWGVRSLAFNSQVLACGGGLGRVSFYDLRASNYIDLPVSTSTAPTAPAAPIATPAATTTATTIKPATSIPTVRSHYDVGQGWLSRDMIYMNHFQGHSIRHAVYTLSYDPTSTRLFAGGGPLQLGLTGSYAAVW
ncbi:hypothetical protein RI367_005599 [Sorochytrium milnesiophthora]